jgi:hypothetical protein
LAKLAIITECCVFLLFIFFIAVLFNHELFRSFLNTDFTNSHKFLCCVSYFTKGRCALFKHRFHKFAQIFNIHWQFHEVLQSLIRRFLGVASLFLNTDFTNSHRFLCCVSYFTNDRCALFKHRFHKFTQIFMLR